MPEYQNPSVRPQTYSFNLQGIWRFPFKLYFYALSLQILPDHSPIPPLYSLPHCQGFMKLSQAEVEWHVLQC